MILLLFQNVEVPQTAAFATVVYFLQCLLILALYGQLLLHAYHAKLRKAYVKLVFARKATAKPGTSWVGGRHQKDFVTEIKQPFLYMRARSWDM